MRFLHDTLLYLTHRPHGVTLEAKQQRANEMASLSQTDQQGTIPVVLPDASLSHLPLEGPLYIAPLPSRLWALSDGRDVVADAPPTDSTGDYMRSVATNQTELSSGMRVCTVRLHQSFNHTPASLSLSWDRTQASTSPAGCFSRRRVSRKFGC